MRLNFGYGSNAGRDSCRGTAGNHGCKALARFLQSGSGCSRTRRKVKDSTDGQGLNRWSRTKAQEEISFCSKILEFDMRWVHMARYELILKPDGAIWLRIISKPLRLPKMFMFFWFWPQSRIRRSSGPSTDGEGHNGWWSILTAGIPHEGHDGWWRTQRVVKDTTDG